MRFILMFQKIVPKYLTSLLKMFVYRDGARNIVNKGINSEQITLYCWCDYANSNSELPGRACIRYWEGQVVNGPVPIRMELCRPGEQPNIVDKNFCQPKLHPNLHSSHDPNLYQNLYPNLHPIHDSSLGQRFWWKFERRLGRRSEWNKYAPTIFLGVLQA